MSNNPEFIIIHHSLSPDRVTRDWPGIVDYHVNEKGWDDVGYHYGIELVKERYVTHKGREESEVGAHCLEQHMNYRSIGICCVGNYDEREPVPEMYQKCAELCADICRRHGIPVENIRPHNEYASYKTCPGRLFSVEKLRSMVKNMLESDNMSKWKDLDQCWYPELAKKAVEEGIISGFEDGTLRPREPVTREQMWLVDLRQQKVISQIPYIPDMVKKYMPSIVRIWNDGTVGSGSFVGPGLILTNHHVVEGADTVSVDTHDVHPANDKLQGEVVKRDKEKDLALVELPSMDHTPLELATEEEVKHGEFCLVLGNPGGEFEAVSAGIVTHDDRGQFIGTDARVNPGNSGGAVIDARGKMIGVPRHKIVLKGFDNQNYCIRVSVVREFLKGVL